MSKRIPVLRGATSRESARPLRPPLKQRVRLVPHQRETKLDHEREAPASRTSAG